MSERPLDTNGINKLVTSLRRTNRKWNANGLRTPEGFDVSVNEVFQLEKMAQVLELAQGLRETVKIPTSEPGIHFELHRDGKFILAGEGLRFWQR